jgi:hypothetical protein
MTDASLRQPLHELIGRFCAAAAVDEPELLGHPAVVSLALDLPIELSVERDGDGALVVLGSPPSQRVATSFLPVFHRMSVRIEREERPPDG